MSLFLKTTFSIKFEASFLLNEGERNRFWSFEQIDMPCGVEK